MEANITLDHVISQEELLGVYKSFCECYNIQIDARDEKRFLLLHYNSFLKEGQLDHRPVMGAKFLGHGKNRKYRFHGYNMGLPEEESRGREFKKRVEIQFSKSPE